MLITFIFPSKLVMAAQITFDQLDKDQIKSVNTLFKVISLLDFNQLCSFKIFFLVTTSCQRHVSSTVYLTSRPDLLETKRIDAQ